MNRTALDGMSLQMADVYAACVDQLLVNLARHFKFIAEGAPIPKSWEYQVQKLAEMGQVTRESEEIILSMLGGADETLQSLLEASIMEGLKTAEAPLRKAAEKGLLRGGTELHPRQMQAFRMFYAQSADRLNLVNTVMLDSTQKAYTATVADIASKIDNTQAILNTAAGEIVTGVAPFNKVLHDSVRKMVDNGITGFIDHGGHHWSPEAYVAMDMRTTMTNTARESVWEQSESYGVDLYQVSWHNGARPKCYPWQGKVISRNGWTGEVEDDEGNKVVVHSESEIESFQYGGGLFGVNCGHYPIPFIPGFSRIRRPEQNEEQNAKEYAESQQQRALERKLREEKRELAVMKAQGATPEEINAQKIRIKNANTNLDDFCRDTGRARQRARETAPINATFPDGYKQTKWERGIKRRDPNTTPAALKQGVNNATMAPTNIFGEEIKFHEKMLKPEYEVTRNQIKTLTSEFNTKLKEVTFGARKGAGTVEISGSIMHLSSPKKRDVVIHEFAHTISISDQTKFGMYNEKPFWDEIRKIRTQYRKWVRDNPLEIISAYADSENKIDEFMAEGFALAYMRENNIEIPHQYGTDATFSKMVLNTVRKYFGK